MSKTKKDRIKKKVIANVTLEQAQEASEQYTTKTTALSKLEAEMNAEINEVKSKYQDDITELMEALEDPTETLQVYATEQRANWGKKKSVQLLHTVIGFRSGNPKVDKKKSFTWDAITILVKKCLPEFVRTKDELNKEAILALKPTDKKLEKLKDQCFISIGQDETFYVEAKKEEVSELA
jgi:phage host-nuclease inhibitor protein Gam